MVEGVSSHVCSNLFDFEAELSDAFATEEIIDGGLCPVPQPQLRTEPHSMYDEIYSYLWPFYRNSEPKTLQDIGFQINPPPEMMYLFIHSSSGNDRGLQHMPNRTLPRREVSGISHHTGNSRMMIASAPGVTRGFTSKFEAMSYTQRK